MLKYNIYVAPSLRDYHGNWGSMLKVSGRQRDLDEPCECGGRDGERVRERESDRGNGSRWRKVRKTRWNAQRSSFNEKFFFLLLFSLFTPLSLLFSEGDICSPFNSFHSFFSGFVALTHFFPLLSSLLFQHLWSRSPPKNMLLVCGL